MASPLPLQTISTDTWVEATWEAFLTFADDPVLASGRFYYDQGYMRIEMSPLGAAHGQDNTVLSTLVNLYAAVKMLSIKGFTNTTFRKAKVRESQPDLAFYVGQGLKLPPYNNAPVNLDECDPPTLVIEIAASSLEDECDRQQRLYQHLGVREYWVVNVNTGQVFATALSNADGTKIRESQVLPGLGIDLVEKALRRSRTEEDGAISRWLLNVFSELGSAQ
ncbi:Uma2 family endonuclease [Thermocoleostomius sinensis]|uniref:Uma2 family endonuclease n=1 Tax=Thermocoleostomius sinensis A174 TaxID=2016057 RepID=A0A9E9C4B1_9CYAN|nr:Uma2 family endonuclease [Thermocoleostomius sinensis]WAL59851.1 Uma2 family endonuclease [Thermocoleostomius sinensis A174]